MNTSFETKNTGNKMGKDEWLTPPDILKKLGNFDLDPCSPIYRPWDIAKNHYTINDNGLLMPWAGRVFCNPPYGKETGDWLNKCALHRNCIALIFARTETKTFFNYVWDKADGLLFLKGRPRFYHVDGTMCKTNMPGAPSVLVAYGGNNAKVLKSCGIPGKFINLTYNLK